MMNVIGFSGLHQNALHKQRVFPRLSSREYRVAQGYDSAAALVTDAGVVAAAAEERFVREKATGRFPEHAIRYCLAEGKLAESAIDFVAHSFSYEPFKEFFTYDTPSRDQYDEVYAPDVQRRNLEHFFPGCDWGRRLVPVAHHLAHAASAYYPSGFSEALLLVSDGLGEIHSLTVAAGSPKGIQVIRQIPALHSLGVLYGVFTLYLGLYFGLDEYKVMGLAPYGDPRKLYDRVSELVRLHDDGTYSIPILASNRTALEKETHRGVLGELIGMFGPPRAPGSEFSGRDKDLAAALQAVVQATQLHVLRHFRRETGLDHVCLAGGVALNCSANGVIRRSRLFKRLFIQPAAGDDGSALGAALYVHRKESPTLGVTRRSAPLWGPGYSRAEIAERLARRNDCVIHAAADFQEVCRWSAGELAKGRIVGWFRGRMEFGPRALGNRSILADPRDPNMRDRINGLVKKREAFRPFAPVVTREAAATYFDLQPGDEDAFAHMLVVTQVRSAYRPTLPAITHVDGSARAQTVSREDYPHLWELLRAFEAVTGMPILLNTSFNVKGQPIVCTPEEAIDTFLFAGLDVLVIDDFLVTAQPGEAGAAARAAAGNRISIGVG